jgi:hypothetical protein
MTNFRLFGAVLVFSTIAIMPVSAQEAVSEPGMLLFYRPNADVLHAGTAGAPSNAMAQARHNGVGATQMSVRSPRMHRATPAKRN